ncbi:hypothetical protein HYC85_013213 [Camellia sinensis]|uniref:Uncharacterized protein n=1 Tax=Camellia sinensis TaxID=4442 RepID=A0A7J7H666_CAMSI|nr:hypothetical protein HYC85_013213 [Camellia sinensis]
MLLLGTQLGLGPLQVFACLSLLSHKLCTSSIVYIVDAYALCLSFSFWLGCFANMSTRADDHAKRGYSTMESTTTTPIHDVPTAPWAQKAIAQNTAFDLDYFRDNASTSFH